MREIIMILVLTAVASLAMMQLYINLRELAREEERNRFGNRLRAILKETQRPCLKMEFKGSGWDGDGATISGDIDENVIKNLED